MACIKNMHLLTSDVKKLMCNRLVSLSWHSGYDLHLLNVISV